MLASLSLLAAVMVCMPDLKQSLLQLTLIMPPHPVLDLGAITLSDYAGVVQCLLRLTPEAVSAAVQQAPAIQQAVLSALLDRCLPFLAAHSSPEVLADTEHVLVPLVLSLEYALDAPCLRNELARRLEQPQGAAYIRQALRLVAALPLRPRPGAEADTFYLPHAGAAVLLGHLCYNSPSHPANTAAAVAWPVIEALPR